jgi:hypothetical protein
MTVSSALQIHPIPYFVVDGTARGVSRKSLTRR